MLQRQKINDIIDYFGPNDDPIKYLKISNKIIFGNDKFGRFGWGELEDYDWYIKVGYKYCGEINLRKEKLKKINEKFG